MRFFWRQYDSAKFEVSETNRLDSNEEFVQGPSHWIQSVRDRRPWRGNAITQKEFLKKEKKKCSSFVCCAYFQATIHSKDERVQRYFFFSNPVISQLSQEEDWKSPTRIQLILDLLDALNDNVSAQLRRIEAMQSIRFLEMVAHPGRREEVTLRRGRFGGREVQKERTCTGSSNSNFSSFFVRTMSALQKLLDLSYEKARELGATGAFAECTSFPSQSVSNLIFRWRSVNLSLIVRRRKIRI